MPIVQMQQGYVSLYAMGWTPPPDGMSQSARLVVSITLVRSRPCLMLRRIEYDSLD